MSLTSNTLQPAIYYDYHCSNTWCRGPEIILTVQYKQGGKRCPVCGWVAIPIKTKHKKGTYEHTWDFLTEKILTEQEVADAMKEGE